MNDFWSFCDVLSLLFWLQDNSSFSSRPLYPEHITVLGLTLKNKADNPHPPQKSIRKEKKPKTFPVYSTPTFHGEQKRISEHATCQTGWARTAEDHTRSHACQQQPRTVTGGYNEQTVNNTRHLKTGKTSSSFSNLHPAPDAWS